MRISYVTWDEFVAEMDLIKNDQNIIYLGHANHTWSLTSTLHRFINSEQILSSDYHRVLLEIAENKQINKHLLENKIFLPNISPFKNGMLVGDKIHKREMQHTVNFMILLRHLGFPSPILDWTKKPYVAAFFALAEPHQTENIAIYQINKPSSSPLFGKYVYFSELNFDGSIISRHIRQDSVYALCLEQTHADTLYSQGKKKGPTYLNSFERILQDNNIELKKHIITHSKQERISLLKKLYDEYSQSFDHIYDQTHILENTILKDLAIKTLLFPLT